MIQDGDYITAGIWVTVVLLIGWFVQRDRQREIEKKGLPSYLKFTEEHILFLEG